MALLIATMAVIAERPFYTDQDLTEFLRNVSNVDLVSKRNRLFDPLEPSEEPDLLQAGSSKVLRRPLGHLWESCTLSFYVPWPMGRWPVGLRHKLSPPTDPNAKTAIEKRTDDIHKSRSSLKGAAKAASALAGHDGDDGNEQKMDEESEEIQPKW
jgi:hypothetical protein